MEEQIFLNLIISELEDSNVTLDTKFRDLDEWDSLTGMSIIIVLEQKYGVKISDDLFKKFNTFLDIFEYVSLNK